MQALSPFANVYRTYTCPAYSISSHICGKIGYHPASCPYLSSIGMIKAVWSTSKIVATLAINFVASMNALGLNCNFLSRCLSAVPVISGFNLLACVANVFIAVLVKSISYTPPAYVVNTGV